MYTCARRARFTGFTPECESPATFRFLTSHIGTSDIFRVRFTVSPNSGRAAALTIAFLVRSRLAHIYTYIYTQWLKRTRNTYTHTSHTRSVDPYRPLVSYECFKGNPRAVELSRRVAARTRFSFIAAVGTLAYSQYSILISSMRFVHEISLLPLGAELMLYLN